MKITRSSRRIDDRDRHGNVCWLLSSAMPGNSAGESMEMSAAADIVVESYTIASGDPGIDLHIRNKRLRSLTSFSSDNVLLYVHGSPEPAECSFDLAVSGPSWMDHLASLGFDAYLVDIRGHGRSTRFDKMAEPPSANQPLLSSEKALADFERAVSHVLERRRLEKLHLMGWSRGCTLVGAFAEAHPARVNRIVLVGPSYQTAPAILSPVPAYLAFNREAAINRWFRGVPMSKRKGFVPEAWIEAWWQANMERDPDGAVQDPSVYRGPAGWFHFADEYLRARKPFFYDPANIGNPVLLLVGEWDDLSPPAGCQSLHDALVNAPSRRISYVREGTHYMHREKVGKRVIREVACFLMASENAASDAPDMRDEAIQHSGPSSTIEASPICSPAATAREAPA